MAAYWGPKQVLRSTNLIRNQNEISSFRIKDKATYQVGKTTNMKYNFTDCFFFQQKNQHQRESWASQRLFHFHNVVFHCTLGKENHVRQELSAQSEQVAPEACHVIPLQTKVPIILHTCAVRLCPQWIKTHHDQRWMQRRRPVRVKKPPKPRRNGRSLGCLKDVETSLLKWCIAEKNTS